MPTRPPLSTTEKERIYRGKLGGRTLVDLSAQTACSLECARKWWRQGRDHGLQGLRASRRGRHPTGCLSRFDARVTEKALALKRQHPRWGPKRVRVELVRAAEFQNLPLPRRSQLAAFFKLRCPECVASRHPRPSPPAPLPHATGVHEMWQLDMQEGLRLGDGGCATVCNIRDPVGAAIIASHAFQVATARHWRKLDWVEVRQVLRNAFAEWHTLPDGVQTDNELGLAGNPNDPFPGRLTMWLVGLGIAHRLIRAGHPTDQPHVERNHRTVDDLALNDEALADMVHLQAALDRERIIHNEFYPSEASNCAGRPPLLAHPELRQPRRFYQPELELALFDLQRVYDYLAPLQFERKVNSSGQVSLGRIFYSVGRRWAGSQVHVNFDAQEADWIFQTPEGEAVARRPARTLTAQELTGLDPAYCQSAVAVQLTLPCFVA